ncbi:hypothetical protein E2562_023486 [Oryza meyeriana var. granulata]|uniref:DUF4378 domain-containing protein n=1 Tax=Oryza meyeriana var. granulata TaxID=110450 RepID=A0A6G1C0U5_9ORYZ|nr:hypothetical protein E2562_023486 [Oryza meyeriana var. granulata]
MKTSKHHWFSSSRSRSRSSAPPPPPPPPPLLKNGRPSPEAHPGCMAMMHYLIFAPGAGCVGRPPSSVVTSKAAASPSHTPPGEAGGLQAPRNSLDLDADHLRRDIQIGVQIEPAFDALARPRPSAPPSEAETPRTPSLVARLMGIDGLPDSPAGSTDTKPREKKKRVIPESISLRQPLRELSRSLPDTPRASTSSVRAATPTWDVIDHPRLSLQVLKENVLDRAAHYMSMPTSPTSLSGGAKKKKTRSRREAAESRSTKEHAVREIVRQARETVTNRKSKKNAAAVGKENASPVHHLSGKENAAPPAGKPAAAPPMRAPLADQLQPHGPRLPLQPRPAPPPPPPQQQRAKPSRPPPPPPPLDPPPRATPPAAVKCKRPDGCERFATRIKKPAPPVAPASSTDRDIVVPGVSVAPSSGVPVEEDPEYVYLRRVLERGGFMRTRAAASRPFKGHSVETPVDPLVFHLLELELPADEARLGPLRHRWNRKLLFHLTQEMVAEQLLGLDPTSPSQHHQLSGAALVARLWRRARSFPAADCRVLEDVLALVALDVEAAGLARRVVERRLVADEGDDVAEEVAERVLEALLDEYCAAEIAAVAVGGVTGE